MKSKALASLRGITLLLIIGFPPAFALASPTPSFTGLGAFPGFQSFYSQAFDVSADGSVVVGHSQGTSGFEAFRWTEATGLVGLGDIVGGGFDSVAYGVSAGGNVVTGYGESENAGLEAMRWTQETGMIGLPHLQNGFQSGMWGISGDGSTSVGYERLTGGTDVAIRWTSSGGTQAVGSLPPGFSQSQAFDASFDGSVIVGFVQGSTQQAFRWTATTGIVPLGDLAGSSVRSQARDVSSDGNVIVGVGRSSSGTEAFRWTPSTGMVGLGDLPGDIFFSDAYGVSADGSIIVGRSVSSPFDDDGAFIWQAGTGMRSFTSVLTDDFGLNLAGWALSEARAISADGTTIVGWGINPNNRTEAFRAVIPEPATLLLLVLTLLRCRVKT